ncbi:TasA family protein [Microbacterium sp. AZCO]|uniref:TasA family protein n=1 Tax=Microbacterium sp. AZCO TaxID=3142976 RepID=UPI0031F34243
MSTTPPKAPAGKAVLSRKRILIPLAGLLVASAIAVGSGADFVANSVNSANAFTTGTLQQTNSRGTGAIFNLSDLKPGDTVVGKVTITNSGTLPANIKLSENAVNGFTTKSNLTLTITAAGSTTPVWSGTFGALTGAAPVDLGAFAKGEAREYTFAVTLAQTAGNDEQGKTASASYTWSSTQTAATTYNQ